MATQNIEEELTTYEQAALERVITDGPQYASSGSSAIFDAMWELVRRSMLVEEYRFGPVYVRATTLGLEAYARSKGHTHPSVRDSLNILLDEAGIDRKEYETISYAEFGRRLAKKRGEAPLRKKKRPKS